MDIEDCKTPEKVEEDPMVQKDSSASRPFTKLTQIVAPNLEITPSPAIGAVTVKKKDDTLSKSAKSKSTFDEIIDFELNN